MSGSSDGDAIVWNLRDGVEPVVLKGHSGNVNIVDGVYASDNQHDTFVVTASLDSTIKIWYRHQQEGENMCDLIVCIIL